MRRKKYNWDLPEKIRNRLGESSYGRQRVIFEENHLLIILHAPPGSTDLHRDTRVFLRKPSGEWQSDGKEYGEAKLKTLIESYQSLFQKLEDDYEKQKTADDLFQLLELLVPVSRAANNFAEALQEARTHAQADSFLIVMRDKASSFQRNFELLLADAKLSLDYKIAKNSELQASEAQKMAASQHKLNLLAAITFPLMAVATIFGMNLMSGFEDAESFYFWLVFAAGIVLGLVTMKWVTNSKK
jgi:Mg2+ and Co2+ transporter CorA